MSEYKRIYAVDFDGTLTVTKFPEIIKPRLAMFLLCKEIKKRGDILILWTCRCGEDLEAAVEYCRKHGLEFDYINENVPENVAKWGNDSRKIFAHEYIDDKSWSPDREEAWKKERRKAFMRGAESTMNASILFLAMAVIICILKITGVF